MNNLNDAGKAVLAGSYDSSSSSSVSILTPTSLGENSIQRATGFINVPAGGQVEFTSTTDDGSWLFVDGTYLNGTQVIYDNTSHGSTAFSGTVSLLAGLHSIDWLYWNGGGPGSGNLTASGGGFGPIPLFVQAANFSNVGYVLKFSGNLIYRC